MLKRNTTIIPAFDYILNDKKNAKYGRGCAKIIFEVIGENGSVTLTAFTNWYLPETIKEIVNIADKNAWANMLSIHSKTELDNDKEALLEYTDGGECYHYTPYSCSYEQKLVELMIRNGSDTLFDKLEETYNNYLA